MAIISQVERQAGNAWIAALGDHTDLTDIAGLSIVRESDQGAAAGYPVVVVSGTSAWTPTEFQNIGVDISTVDLSVRTNKYDDPDRSVCDSAFGAVRDLFRDDSIAATLSGKVVNFQVKAIEEREPSVLIPDDVLHIRTMSATITAIATD